VSIVVPNEKARPDWSPDVLVLEKAIIVEVDGTLQYYANWLLRKVLLYKEILGFALLCGGIIRRIVKRTYNPNIG
jgi:hypothetical protein